MRTLKDLGLHKKTQKKVEAWLQEWLDLFIKQANGKSAWVYRVDFVKDNFFYFTDCKDILEKDPEAKGQEHNLAIRKRKRKILMQLFIKTLLGQNLMLNVITCNHCGYRGCWIEGLKDGNGHWVYCPKCKKTDIHVFPDGYDKCMDTIKQEIAIKEMLSPATLTPLTKRKNCRKCRGKRHMLINPKCKHPLEEIQAYKYKHAAKNLNDPGMNPKPKCPKCKGKCRT